MASRTSSCEIHVVALTEEPSLKVTKWTDWFNLLERRGKWEHWMVGPCPDQVRYGFWLNSVTGEKWDGRVVEPRWGSGLYFAI